MDTFMKANLAMIIQTMDSISTLPTKGKMDPEGEAEVEGEEKGIEG